MAERWQTKYANKGLSGIANVGNTCYLNSCMQIISHTYELNDILANDAYKTKLNNVPDSVVLVEWHKLQTVLWNQNCTVVPNRFVTAVQRVAAMKHRDLFTGHDQNDVAEFLLFIIDCFHTALEREVDMEIVGQEENDTDKLASVCYKMMKDHYTKHYSEMLNVFFGIHVSEITAVDTAKPLSVAPEPFSVISLPIPNNNKHTLTLFDCMDLYCEKELLQEDNAWYNDQTQRKETAVNRAIVFWKLPDILIIDFKRWNDVHRKIQVLIQCPLTGVDFSKYVKGYNPSSYVYDLFGVCNHSGGVMGGHYTANIKNANGKWYSCNDTIIHELTDAQVITVQAYCLFFRKRK
jgi:ubiquitin carboxyl-terminal hydrolase 8